MVVKHEYFIGYQYIDSEFKIKNSAMLSMFEDLACIHGARAGEDIKTAPTVWLLTAYKVRVIRRPEYGEYVDVLTWSRNMRGVLAFREFEIRNKDGELLVCAVSEWAHIQKADGRPARVTPELEAMYASEPEHTNFEGERLRPTRPTETFESELSYTVGRNWIDVNRHMNNVHYIELAELLLPENAVSDIAKCGFEIYYRKEIKYGETVLCRYEKEDGAHTVNIKSADGEVLHAQIKFA